MTFFGFAIFWLKLPRLLPKEGGWLFIGGSLLNAAAAKARLASIRENIVALVKRDQHWMRQDVNCSLQRQSQPQTPSYEVLRDVTSRSHCFLLRLLRDSSRHSHGDQKEILTGQVLLCNADQFILAQYDLHLRSVQRCSRSNRRGCRFSRIFNEEKN